MAYQYEVMVDGAEGYRYTNPIKETRAETKAESLALLTAHCNAWAERGRPDVGRRLYMRAKCVEVR